MATPRVLSRPTFDPSDILRALLFAAGTALAAGVSGFILFVLGMRLLFLGQALPGVTVAGVDVGGMNRSQIELALGSAITYPETGRIVLEDGNRHWTARPDQLGILVDAPGMAQAALSVGRQGNMIQRFDQQLTAWYDGTQLPPLIIFDQRSAASYMASIASEIDRPTIEAQLRLEGTQVIDSPGQIGRLVDIPATLQKLMPSVQQMHDTQVELVVVDNPPTVLSTEREAAIARRLLSAPLLLTAEGAEPLSLEPADLAPRISFEVIEFEDGARYQMRINPESLGPMLEPLGPELERDPQNARFIFNDDTHELDLLEPAVIGRSLDVAESIAAVNQGINQGLHEINLAFDTTDPQVLSDATAEDLGITENVVAVSTYFSGSSSARIQNITKAASVFHGLLLAPGETLSMAEQLGDISLDSGYAEALIIYGDRTIKGVGGGVCQVSTTLFRAAFFGGYELVERHPHAYRVLYYEQGPGSPGPGLDATVFVPVVDFKFRNDTEHWLLLETYIYGNQLLWKFYSTSDGRTVDWTSSGPRNVVEAPEPLYKENPDLDEGEIDQVDFEADGMDVVVTRTVRRGEQILHDDVIRTHYLAWRAIYEYGPGTDLPDDAQTE